jgi:hypothetical protein
MMKTDWLSGEELQALPGHNDYMDFCQKMTSLYYHCTQALETSNPLANLDLLAAVVTALSPS